MMKSIRKSQNSWFTKTILLLTALSFMSLFGVAGYLGSAGKNKPIISVDNIEVLQGDFAILAEDEVNKVREMLGDNYNENIKVMILNQTISKTLNDMIMKRTTDKYNISISDEEVRKIIFSQTDFHNQNGKFDINLMRRLLIMNGMKEARYIDMVKNEIIKNHILNTPVENINIPTVMAENLAKAQNMKKFFEYIKIDTSNIAIDRKITPEEEQQYYQDFISSWTIPEKRDIEFVFISNDNIFKGIEVSDEEINEAYKTNLEKYETPEKREISQIIYDSEEEALIGMKRLHSGEDFYTEAKKQGLNKDEANLGLVSADMLIEEVSSIAFVSESTGLTKLIKSDLGWHILKINKIIPSSKTPFETAKREIIAEIKQEKSFENIQDIVRNIDDKIASGMSIDELAKEYKAPKENALGLQANGEINKISKQYKSLSKNNDFIDMAFSYEIDEITQVIETSEGLAILSIKNIIEAKPKDISVVRKDVEKIWANNEKISIVEEIIEDVIHDLEEGDSMKKIANRFSLNMRISPLIKRSENFENIPANAMLQLFLVDYDTPKVVDMNDIKIIAVPKKISIVEENLTQSEIVRTKAFYKLAMMKEYSNNLINDFAEEYKIKIDYKALNLYE